jgi:hypothetical protein
MQGGFTSGNMKRQICSRPFLAIEDHWRTVMWVIFNPNEVRMPLTALPSSDYKVGNSFWLIGVRVHIPARCVSVLLDCGERAQEEVGFPNDDGDD